MTTYTAENFLASPRFIEIASAEAFKVLAKTHNVTVERIISCLPLSSNLQRQLADLITAAAEESAKRA